MNKSILLLTLVVLLQYDTQAQMPVAIPGPRALVYKTRKDYSKLVSVLLSEDGKTIVSYPDPADVKTNGRYLYPTKLHKGYLLDNRGIGTNTAFLSISYGRYARLKKLPSQAELNAMIVDKAPFTELCDCGLLRDYKNPAKEINALIDKKQLRKKCKPIK